MNSAMSDLPKSTRTDQPVKATASWRYALPNAVTLAALFFGLSALTYGADGLFVSAIACILIATLLDAMDGRVARATGASSKFGAELDSLADVVCFGAVPAFIMYRFGLLHYGAWGWVMCLAYQAAVALRLARFNVAITDPAAPSWNMHFFAGIPAPAGAFLVLTPIYAEYAGLLDNAGAIRLAMVMTPLVALLMVSTWPTFSSKSMSRKALRLFFVPTLMVSSAIAVGLLFAPWITLTTGSVLYTLSLPFSKLRHQAYRRAKP